MKLKRHQIEYTRAGSGTTLGFSGVLASTFLALAIAFLVPSVQAQDAADTREDNTSIAAPAVKAPEARQPLRVLLLGDSLTHGLAGERTYRYYIWKSLVEAGFDVDMLGTQPENFGGGADWPAVNGQEFDADHEGHKGWRVDHILNGREGEGRLKDWLQTYTPDVAVIVLGTNDAVQGQPARASAREVHRVIDTLRSDNDRVAIVLGLPNPGTRNGMENIPDLAVHYPPIAERLHTRRSPVVVADIYHGYDIQTMNKPDNMHPNDLGEQFMADRVFEAMMQLDESHLYPQQPDAARTWFVLFIIPMTAAIGFIFYGRHQVKRDRQGDMFPQAPPARPDTVTTPSAEPAVATVDAAQATEASVALHSNP